MVRRQLLLVVVMCKERVVLLPGALLHPLVLVGDRPLLPAFVSKVLQLVVLQVMLLPVLSLPVLWKQRLLGLTRAQLLVLVLVRVGTCMWLVVLPLMVLMQLLMLACARLLLHGFLGRDL
jgi:hypothetical protein